MCSQFIINNSGKELARQFKAKEKGESITHGRVVPHRPAPVVKDEKGGRVVTDMEFGLIPAWSKDRRVRFATHNARLMSLDPKNGANVLIFQKPTWREAFAHRHCLVPMTTFIEPLYSGPLAGNMVGFQPKGGGVMAAAGIWEEWASKKSGEMVESFTVLTDEPDPHIAQMGHDRSPVFLDEGDYSQWLKAETHKPAEWLEFLRTHRKRIDWTEEIDRPLAKGWEKRVE